MADDLYHDDFYAWTKSQAAALRARRVGGNALDYENLAEEVESLGRSDERACESHIDLILQHLLKIEHVPRPEDAPGWRKEVRAFRKNLLRNLSPSLKAQLSTPQALLRIYAAARAELVADMADDGIAVSPPQSCPYDWADITGRDADWMPEPCGQEGQTS